MSLNFWKRGEALPPVNEDQPHWAPRWEQVVARYPVGARFPYLGRELLVVEHRTSFLGYGPGAVFCGPTVVTHYCDGQGRLRRWQFDVDQLDLLLVLNSSLHPATLSAAPDNQGFPDRSIGTSPDGRRATQP